MPKLWLINPQNPLNALVQREGQQIVTDGGNISLDAATVKECRRRLAE